MARRSYRPFVATRGSPVSPAPATGSDGHNERPSRREALVRIGSTAGVLVGVSALGRAAWDEHGSALAAESRVRKVRDYRVSDPSHAQDGFADLAIARGEMVDVPTLAADLVGKALDALGGMKRFVSRGEVVAVKPNIGWDRLPIHAANTNPDVVGAVIEQAFNAGAKKVIVADGSCNDPDRCYQRSGIWRKAYSLGAEVVLPAEHLFRTMRMNGEILDEWPIFATLIEVDKVINVPVAKHHNLARFTCGMKNWYGIVGGRRNRLHQSIDVSIADLATFVRPSLVVVDAMRVLVRNGPQGGNIDDTRVMNTIVASTDQVAADAFACTLIGQHRENLGYLKVASDRGVGTMLWENLRVREV